MGRRSEWLPQIASTWCDPRAEQRRDLWSTWFHCHSDNDHPMSSLRSKWIAFALLLHSLMIFSVAVNVSLSSPACWSWVWLSSFRSPLLSPPLGRSIYYCSFTSIPTWSYWSPVSSIFRKRWWTIDANPPKAGRLEIFSWIWPVGFSAWYRWFYLPLTTMIGHRCPAPWPSSVSVFSPLDSIWFSLFSIINSIELTNHRHMVTIEYWMIPMIPLQYILESFSPLFHCQSIFWPMPRFSK